MPGGRGGFDHGFRGGGFRDHEGHFHGGFGTDVFIGPWWYPWGYPYWDYGYGYGYYPPPSAYYDPYYDEPQEYVQQQGSGTGYWYYCPSSRAYYPDVHECDQEWLRVVPRQSGD